MAFVLPNGTVVDPEKDDREMILNQIADRRRLGAQERAQKRASDTQTQMLQAEREEAREDRKQTGELTREQIAAQKDMAKSAEESLAGRLKNEREATLLEISETGLRTIDAEQEQADSWAKRINRQLSQHETRHPGVGADPVKIQEWNIGRDKIMAQIPIGFESAIINDGGVFRVDPGFFEIKRARYRRPGAAPAGSSKIGAALAAGAGVPPSDDIARARGMVNIGRSGGPGVGAGPGPGAGAGPGAGRGGIQKPGVPPMDTLGGTNKNPVGPALSQSGTGFIPAAPPPMMTGTPPAAMPVGGSPAIPPGSMPGIGDLWAAFSKMFGGGVPVGGQPFNVPREVPPLLNTPLPNAPKYEVVGY